MEEEEHPGFDKELVLGEQVALEPVDVLSSAGFSNLEPLDMECKLIFSREGPLWSVFDTIIRSDLDDDGKAHEMSAELFTPSLCNYDYHGGYEGEKHPELDVCPSWVTAMQLSDMTIEDIDTKAAELETLCVRLKDIPVSAKLGCRMLRSNNCAINSISFEYQDKQTWEAEIASDNIQPLNASQFFTIMTAKAHKLTKLRVLAAELDDSNGFPFVLALHRCVSLRQLHLSGLDMQSVSGPDAATCFMTSPFIKRFSISCSNFAEIQHVFKYLVANTRMHHMGFPCAEVIDDKVAKQLAKLFIKQGRRNKGGLTSVDLRKCAITNKGGRYLLKALDHNLNVLDIQLEGNPIDAKLMADINAKLEANQVRRKEMHDTVEKHTYKVIADVVIDYLYGEAEDNDQIVSMYRMKSTKLSASEINESLSSWDKMINPLYENNAL